MSTLTTDQAAERLGVTPSRVRVLIRSGRLPAQKFGRAHVINESDLQLVADRPVGRPATKPKAEAEAKPKPNKASGPDGRVKAAKPKRKRAA